MSERRDFLNMAELDADKLELFEYLLEEEGVAGASPADRISPRERAQRLPLSFAQQRFWFLEQLEPGSPAYHIAGALRMVGPLDTAALRRSLNEIVRRHESLRTSFVVVAGRPEQVIAPDSQIALPVEDLTALASAERDAEVGRLSKEEARRPFDLSQSPLWRARLLRLEEEEHVLLLTMHHIISDGWSSGVMVRELGALYEAYGKGEESPLEELSVQYGDYAVWQRERMAGEALDSQLDYWRRQLSGELSVLELPTRRARASVQTFRAAAHTQVLPLALCDELKELSLKEDATLFMTLLAALQVLLSRYSGQTDPLVGTPVAGRTRAETEPLIGCFVNTLVMRTHIDERQSFRELLAQAKEVCLEAYAHQEAPFEKLVEELQPERSLSRTPLFQVMFTLQNAPMPVVELSGLKLSLLESDTEAAQFDLALEVTEAPEGLKTLWRYNRDLFDAAIIERMAEQFRVLLEGVAADCGVCVAELPLLTERERGRLLFELNETATDYPRNACIHELFERRAEETPDAVALSFEEERLTYRELNRRANQVAHHLINMGVGPEMCVGIMLERSVEMVVGLLGILKAGGAYVPLDPSYPDERLSFMIDDALILVLLTQERHLDSAFAQQVVCLDGDWELIAAESTENPPSKVNAESLAYVVYTSGSTGRPKGVCVTHRAVVRLVCQTNYADFSPDDVFLQLAPVTFDASTFEIWGALLNGARLVVMPPGVALTEEIGAALVRHRVTTLWLTAGLFHLMVEERLEDLRGLRQLLAGGDVLSVSHVNRFVGECGAGRLTNGYGPTENTTFTCCHRVEPEEHGASVPVGKPVSNTRVYILDGRMRPVGAGIVGELYAGGDGLARCYLNRPELTAEKFVPDPFGGEPGARLYRTGDLARYRSDGTIEFVGRRDQQVKLRGFRIELGEVEAALQGHAAVRGCLALVREDAPGDKRLVAYFTAAETGAPTSDALRRHLREKLPEYMIPSAFVALEAFPLTDNGKIDRRALPAPEDYLQPRENLFVAPRDETEEALAAIIRDVLGVERVSVYDNFFDIGGHSLLATQVITRVRDTLHVELPLKRFFEHPLIAELAATIEPLGRAGLGDDAPPIARAPRDGALPLSFAQQRLWFLDQLEPGNAIYNLPTALRLRGALDIEALRRTLNEIVRRHESLRTVFREEQGGAVQVILPGQFVEMPVLNVTGLHEAEREAEAERLAREEARKGFDLSRGPLLRARLLRLSTEDHLLLFTMHHIVSDGWSSGVLVREAAALYEAYVQGRESPLPELPVQYADYAVWQREWLQGAALAEQLAYWREQLDGSPGLLEFPTDHPRPAALTFRGAARNFELPTQLTEELRALGRREGVTLYMILLAAFQSLLSRYTGREEIVVGSPIANRQRREIEPLIGFFVNTLVMRTDLSGDPSFRQLLGRVREVTLGAYAHQDIPFEMLVEELQPERSLGFTPLFQMMFVLQNAPGDELNLPGLALKRMDVWSGTTHFDLTLQLEESAQGLTGVVEYSAELFNEETIRLLTRRLQTLLEGVAADPDATLSALPLFTDAEEEQLLARRAAGQCAQTAPAQVRGKERESYVAPRTPAEEILASIWSDVLKVERVGVHDNFFDLGGHSLLATQLMSRVRNAFHLEVPLRRLFEYPNVADLARSIEASLRDGQELQAAPINARTRDGHLPLSFEQQRLWFIDQLQPGASTYQIPIALNIDGRLDAETLERSLAEIARRHESLRTSFTVSDSQPVQVVAPDSGFTLPLLDLSEHSAAERDAEVGRLSKEEARRPFDLSQSPLWRARLLRLEEEEHVLLLTMHHIISDGWSSGVMVRELGALYEAYGKGEESPLEELSVQYGDYAVWQRERMAGEALDSQLDYWKRQLADAPQILELPTTQPRSVTQTFRGAREELTLSPQLTRWLKALSRNEGATLYMTLLAAFKVLLWRYSGQTDILVGSPIANRNRAETEPLIGFFVNTLVMRTHIDERQSFRELLAQAKEVCLEAYAHQEVPFEKLVEELQPERSLSRTPLFQVMFALQNAPMPPLKLDNLNLSLADIAGETAKFDLTLTLEESHGGLSGALEYDSDLFDASVVKRMAGHYRRLLESIVESADAPLSALTLLSVAERRQLLVEWNETERGGAPSVCAHQVFERQAALTPDAAAVVSGQEHVTYGELNRRANRLAHHLRGLGVGPETPVCICVERSAELLVAILGVAKAGGAYVPLDPSYPAQRLSFMLQDSRAPVLLTRERTRGLFEGCEAASVLLDHDAEAIARQSSENPRGDVLPGNLAYVIYTSGSTGRPKGVQITHASLMNLIGWYRRTSPVATGARVAQLSGVGFDATVFELWPNLTVGMTSYLPDEETRHTPEKLRDWLVSNRIIACFAPTPLAELILTLDWPVDTALRALYTGGDTLHHFPGASLPFQVWNSYGPTENTVIATSGRVTPEDACASHAPHIGRPVDNVEIYLLDRNMEPVPVGVRGELYVGGASLARGYANEPGLTAGAFIPHPFAASPGARLYRTGDAARYLSDGRIEFMGRLDQQVKIRGFRVELGEIESVLKKHEDVREAVVICDEVRPGEHRLTAYLALEADAHPSLNKLRGHLTERLPEYMLPSDFVVLERLPLNANGKIDRRALLASGVAHLAPEAAYVAPATEMERVLAKLWQELLDVERVGIHDNFFDLGGHSLLIIRMRGRLQELLRREIAIVEFFKHPTVSALARHLGREDGAQQPARVSPHRQRGEARRESAEKRTRPRPKQPTL